MQLTQEIEQASSLRSFLLYQQYLYQMHFKTCESVGTVNSASSSRSYVLNENLPSLPINQTISNKPILHFNNKVLQTNLNQSNTYSIVDQLELISQHHNSQYQFQIYQTYNQLIANQQNIDSGVNYNKIMPNVIITPQFKKQTLTKQKLKQLLYKSQSKNFDKINNIYQSHINLTKFKEQMLQKLINLSHRCTEICQKNNNLQQALINKQILINKKQFQFKNKFRICKELKFKQNNIHSQRNKLQGILKQILLETQLLKRRKQSKNEE